MLGEIKENNKGTKMKIIAQRSNYDIDVEFLDNHHYVFKHVILQSQDFITQSQQFCQENPRFISVYD